MRADLVAVAAPLLRPDLGVDAITKPLQRQELVAELAIERFVGAILPLRLGFYAACLICARWPISLNF